MSTVVEIIFVVMSSISLLGTGLIIYGQAQIFGVVNDLVDHLQHNSLKNTDTTAEVDLNKRLDELQRMKFSSEMRRGTK